MSSTHEFNIDPGTPLPVAAGHGLRRIVENLHMFHPRRCILSFDYRPGAPNQLARDVWFFRALKRTRVHNSVGPNKKNKTILHECNPV
jgi:hypothetical protein